tara:strand:+ start:240 stop:443 length:204 start_codon:yes stop_codon:yes gene_type:complete
MAQLVENTAGLFVPEHDYVSMTYVASGNGAGEVETITYKRGGASGTVVAVLTLAYNSDNKMTSITKV